METMTVKQIAAISEETKTKLNITNLFYESGVLMAEHRFGFFKVTTPLKVLLKTNLTNKNSFGFLYIIKLGDSNIYKIGTTSDIGRRLPEISRMYNIKSELIFISDHLIENNYKYEKSIQEKYQQYIVGSELFQFDNINILTEVVNYILSIPQYTKK